MRARFVLAFAALAVPMMGVHAQRLPLPGRRVRPAELPPPAPTVARALVYHRLPYSAESYPFVSYHDAGNFMAHRYGTTWLAGGFGQRLDLRIAPLMSATLDVTSSFLGSPVQTGTAELGLRFRPDRDARRLYPFVDVRFGYMQSHASQFRPFDVTDPFGGAPGPDSRWSRGFGGLGGVGAEYALSRMFSLTSSASVMRTRMRTTTLTGPDPDVRWWMTTYRYTIGLRFNPVRTVHTPLPPYPASSTTP